MSYMYMHMEYGILHGSGIGALDAKCTTLPRIYRVCPGHNRGIGSANNLECEAGAMLSARSANMQYEWSPDTESAVAASSRDHNYYGMTPDRSHGGVQSAPFICGQ